MIFSSCLRQSFSCWFVRTEAGTSRHAPADPRLQNDRIYIAAIPGRIEALKNSVSKSEKPNKSEGYKKVRKSIAREYEVQAQCQQLADKHNEESDDEKRKARLILTPKNPSFAENAAAKSLADNTFRAKRGVKAEGSGYGIYALSS